MNSGRPLLRHSRRSLSSKEVVGSGNGVLLITHELFLIAVRAELVEAQESVPISTSSMRTDS
jgi:hypothetical protein